uniref:Death domain-containing protein n=1 Tax=Arion vulgaris TaxID=1028688 RepID=A0A0B7BMJ7_9EUPU
MPVRKGKLKPVDAVRLTRNYSMLLEDIDGQYFVADLFSKGVFTADDKEEVSSQAYRRKRTEVMLDKLLDSGPGEAYNAFIEILAREYPDVAVRLNETSGVDEIPTPDYSWFDSIPDSIKKSIITDADASRLSRSFVRNWKQIMILLGLTETMIDIESQNSPYSTIPILITTLLIKWKQRFYSQATFEALVKVLQEVDTVEACVDWECVKNALQNRQSNKSSS